MRSLAMVDLVAVLEDETFAVSICGFCYIYIGAIINHCFNNSSASNDIFNFFSRDFKRHNFDQQKHNDELARLV